MGRFRHLIGHTAFYTFANAIEALTPIIMIPFLTRYLSRHEYGLWSLFQAAAVVIIPLIGLTLKDAIRMRYLELSREEFVRYLNSVTAITALLALPAVFFVISFQEMLTGWFKLNLDGLIALVAVAALYSFFYTALAICQFAGKRQVFVWLQLMQAGVAITATFLFVLNDSGWKGCVFGRVVGLTAACAAAGLFLAREFGWCRPFQTRLAYVREQVIFGAHYLPFGLFPVVIPLTNRLLIANMVSVGETSLYAIAESFAMLLYLGINGFMHAWQPWLFKRLSGKDASGTHGVVLPGVLFALLLPVAGAALSVAAVIVSPIVLGPAFMEVNHFVFWMMLATSMRGWFLIAQSFVHFRQRVGLMSLCSIVAMVANAWLSWQWIPIYGATGAVWASIAAYLLATAITLIVIARLYRSAR